MSEYQYHEWQTIDRLLTEEEQEAVNALSSHIEVGSSQAVVTYQWGDFKHNPKQVLLDYFDAYFYMANWGSLRLMFRFPIGLLDQAEILPYCLGEAVTLETHGQYQGLVLEFNPEDSQGWMEGGANLSSFIRLRADLIEGDYRLLYLAWLKAMSLDDEPAEDEDDPDSSDYDQEPPVPPGLKKLTPALKSFIRVFEIDPFLVQAAAEASPDLTAALAVDYRALIGRLEQSECDEFLARLAEGEPGIGLALRKRLSAFISRDRPQQDRLRTFRQLLAKAERLEKGEKKRRAEAERQKHIAEMKALAGQEEQTWRQVDSLLDTGRKIASVYDEATALLEKLKQLAEFQDTRDVFQARLQRLAHKYATRPSLIDRWRKRGWVL
jgi:hypothetical protein